jgi:hypothetical protein
MSTTAAKAGGGDGLHVGHHRQPFGRSQRRQHPAPDGHHFLRRDARDQRVVDRHQFGVRVARPQHGVVRGLFDVHVAEVLADEHRQRAVEHVRSLRALLGLQRGQGARGLLHAADLRFMVLMVVRDGRAGAGGARLERGMHEGVLVAQVRAAELHQLVHLAAGALQRLVVAGVDAAQREQRVGHVGPQGLVDGGVEVEARLGGRGDALDFLGIDLHGGLLGVASLRSATGTNARNRPGNPL